MKFSKISIDEWQESLSFSENATFFHHPLWYQLWSKNFDGVVNIIKIENNIYFPYFKRNRINGIYKEHISGPGGTYGGIYTTKQNIKTDSSYQFLLNKFKFITIVENPFDKNEFVRNFSKKTYTNYFNLKNIDQFKITSNWSNNHKRKLNKALKAKLNFRTSKTEKDWENYFQLYKDSMSRWGNRSSSNYEFGLFKSIKNIPTEYRTLYLIEEKNKMLSGAIVFNFNNKHHYWHGASSQNGLLLNSSLFLQYKIIEKLIKLHVYIYDLGPSGGHWGTEEFKRRMKPQTRTMKIVSKKPAIFKLFNK